MAKYKTTGCARFFIVMLILAPLAYLGASYYLGQDGIGNIKELIGIGDSGEGNSGTNDANHSGNNSDTYTPPASENNEEAVPANAQMDDQAGEQAGDQADEQLKQLKSENDALKQRIDELEKQLEEAQSKGDVNH